MIRRTFLLSGFGLTVAAMVSALRASAQDVAAPAYILGATAITQVFGAGQRLVGVAIQQDRAVDSAALDPTLYSVEGRTITKVYASASAMPGPTCGAWASIRPASRSTFSGAGRW